MSNSGWHDLSLAIFALIIAIGIFMGQGLIIAFGVMGMVAGAISVFWNRIALEDVHYERHLPQRRAVIGEDLPMTVSLTNRKPVPLTRVRVDDELPEALRVTEGDVTHNVTTNLQRLRHSTSMSWYERISWSYTLQCKERGMYRIGPAQIESGDPFGFLHTRTTAPHQDSILVYPRIIPLDELGIPAARPLGEARGGIRMFQDLSRPMGLRDYQQGDSLKIVDWKATAKAQMLQVRTFEPSSTFTVILVVAVDTTSPHWASYAPEDLERVVTIAASMAAYAAERQYIIGLFSNDMPISPSMPMTVRPGRGPDQLAEILGALATTRFYAFGPMSSQLAEHGRRFPLGATVVVVTAFLPREFVDTLSVLKHHGHRIVVMYVGEQDCPDMPDGMLVYHLRDHLLELEEAREALAG